MPSPFSTYRTIIGNCEQCNVCWHYEGWDNHARYKAYLSGKLPRLCNR